MDAICPKCGYVRRPTDLGDPGTCPSCGVIYWKYGRSLRAQARSLSNRSLGVCKTCGHKVAKTAMICPNCHAIGPVNLSSRDVFGTLAIVILIVLAFGYWSVPDHSALLHLGSALKNEKESSVFTVNTLSGPQTLELGETIEGEVVNNADVTWDFGIVEYALYDGKGRLLGIAWSSTGHIDPYGVWVFKAPITINGVASWKLKGVKAW